MSEAGDFEMFSAPAAKEHDEKSDEQFREQMAKSQQARQQLQKEEGKARAHDDKLAQIIVQFLAQPANTDLFLLISRCVARNIPSEVLIAILSLTDRKAYEEIGKILAETEKGALLIPEHGDIQSLTPIQKQQIDEWLQNIAVAASTKPHRTLETVLIKKTDPKSMEVLQEIVPYIIQLSAFIMRNFLSMQNTQVEYEKLHEFMQTVYVKMIQDLERVVQGQGRLETSKED